jgi:hypothetical protein
MGLAYVPCHCPSAGDERFIFDAQMKAGLPVASGGVRQKPYVLARRRCFAMGKTSAT